MERVVVLRRFTEPVELDRYLRDHDHADGCFQRGGVRHLETHLSADGRTMLCLFEAPDAEAVRQANRAAGMAMHEVWTADVFEAPAAAPAGDNPAK